MQPVINCPNCNETVPLRAANCPHCKGRLKAPRIQNLTTPFILALFAGIILIIVGGLSIEKTVAGNSTSRGIFDLSFGWSLIALVSGHALAIAGLLVIFLDMWWSRRRDERK